jgi:hypothetical protein
MVRHHIGPIGSLYDAWQAKRDMWLLCQDCGHAAKLDTRTLVLRLGDEASALAFDKLRLRQRLRCRHCRRWHVAFVPHYMPWSAMR